MNVTGDGHNELALLERDLSVTFCNCWKKLVSNHKNSSKIIILIVLYKSQDYDLVLQQLKVFQKSLEKKSKVMLQSGPLSKNIFVLS